jgi:hypothetical protein
MWFKVDDQSYGHPKFLRCSTQAIGVWMLAGAWSSSQLTDGFIPEGALGVIRATGDDMDELTSVGLLARVKGGWKMHDFSDYNPTSTKVKEEREKSAERKRLWREKKAAERAENTKNVTPSVTDVSQRDNTVSHAVRHGPVPPTPTRPDPTRPRPPSPIGDEEGVGGDPHTELALVTDHTAVAKAPANTKTKRGTRLPDGWFPDRTDAALKLENTHDRQWLARELDRFRDYWQAKTGKDATKLDWTKTWCNWLRNAEDHQTRNRPTGPDWNRWAAEARAEDEAERRQTWTANTPSQSSAR